MYPKQYYIISRFIKLDLIPTKTTHSEIDSICQSALTPEYSCIDLQKSEDVMKFSIPQLNEESNKVNLISNEDPDVTQLEIDINTATISISGSQNFKKRQLIDLNENTDSNSIQLNYLPHSQNHDE